MLFGWARVLELFSRLERQLTGHKRTARRSFSMQNSDPQICSMVAIQEFNDHAETTHELVMARLQALSVYQPEPKPERESQASV